MLPGNGRLVVILELIRADCRWQGYALPLAPTAIDADAPMAVAPAFDKRGELTRHRRHPNSDLPDHSRLVAHQKRDQVQRYPKFVWYRSVLAWAFYLARQVRRIW